MDLKQFHALGYSGGAVPESHRVPCTSTLPRESPTTNTQISNGSILADPFQIVKGLCRKRFDRKIRGQKNREKFGREGNTNNRKLTLLRRTSSAS